MSNRLVEMMVAKYGHREADGIYIIPAYVGLDTEHAYPRAAQPPNARTTEPTVRIVNALHLASGYGQLADAILGWLKCMAASTRP